MSLNWRLTATAAFLQWSGLCTMKIISFVEEAKLIEKILRHCKLWKEPAMHPPLIKSIGPPKIESGPALDYTYFDQNCV
jgi:hypothetical protein